VCSKTKLGSFSIHVLSVYSLNHSWSLFHSLWNIQLSLPHHWMSGSCCFYGNGTSIMSKHHKSHVFIILDSDSELLTEAYYMLWHTSAMCTELSSFSHLQNFHIRTCSAFRLIYLFLNSVIVPLKSAKNLKLFKIILALWNKAGIKIKNKLKIT